MNWWTIGRSRRIFHVVIGLLLGGELAMASVVAASPADTPHAPLSVAVVGDHNSAGMRNSVVWPTLMAERTGWSVSNFALPDAGFAADGMGGQAFTYQVDRALAGHPKVILIVDGTADSSVSNTEAITIGATDAINKITLGGQRAAVVGPMWYETPAPESLRRVNEAVRKVAEQAGVPFLDALDPPLLGKDLMYRDLSGPTDQGQSVIADKITAWLRMEVVR